MPGEISWSEKYPEVFEEVPLRLSLSAIFADIKVSPVSESEIYPLIEADCCPHTVVGIRMKMRAANEKYFKVRSFAGGH